MPPSKQEKQDSEDEFTFLTFKLDLIKKPLDATTVFRADLLK